MKDIPYLSLSDELWGVFCWCFRENWPRYNGIALHKSDTNRFPTAPFGAGRAFFLTYWARIIVFYVSPIDSLTGTCGTNFTPCWYLDIVMFINIVHFTTYKYGNACSKIRTCFIGSCWSALATQNNILHDISLKFPHSVIWKPYDVQEILYLILI